MNSVQIVAGDDVAGAGCTATDRVPVSGSNGRTAVTIVVQVNSECCVTEIGQAIGCESGPNDDGGDAFPEAENAAIRQMAGM